MKTLKLVLFMNKSAEIEFTHLINMFIEISPK